ncbi:hypothetical protein FB45DRAFT_1037095 [Roridomyces roridus]|uniref:Uncharacterized protein n=1 Tax=Roridomyces roridus TaxID=1738132 RepID=A0AAD7B6K3_9AGAR|nr:hypothetical protein FB45DRAFT_1037095 [Roridomyces roridus]
MVLTRSQAASRMRITRWPPNEVLAELTRLLPKAAQAALCRTSKLFHALALPILSRSVFLSTGRLKALEAFCSGMIQNPERATALRSLTFWSKSPGANIHQYDVLIEVIKLMTKLENLMFSEDSTAAHHLARGSLRSPSQT